MGTWGAGLYDDDFASDLQYSVSLITKIPLNGDRLLDILLQQQGEMEDLAKVRVSTFWLVVADQFERRGIFSSRVFQMARSIIESSTDQANIEKLEPGERFLFLQRKNVLEKLLARIMAPRPARKLPAAPKPPGLVVSPGQLYVFPTMGFQACNPGYPTWEHEGFKPDGWGAFLVVDSGRAFDWLPWCAVSSLAVPKDRPATFEEAVRSTILINGHFKAPAIRCIPKQSHLKRMQSVLIGNVELNSTEAKKIVANAPSVEETLECGRSICGVVFGYSPAKPLGPKVSDVTTRG